MTEFKIGDRLVGIATDSELPNGEVCEGIFEGEYGDGDLIDDDWPEVRCDDGITWFLDSGYDIHVVASEAACGAHGGCDLPAGHNRGKADVPENHGGGDARKRRKHSPRGAVLADATDLIHGDRNKHYGAPTENFDRIAAIWNVQLAGKFKDGATVNAGDVADLMIAVKLARTVNQPKRDNYVDIAGYAACGWEAREAQ